MPRTIDELLAHIKGATQKRTEAVPERPESRDKPPGTIARNLLALCSGVDHQPPRAAESQSKKHGKDLVGSRPRERSSMTHRRLTEASGVLRLNQMDGDKIACHAVSSL